MIDPLAPLVVALIHPGFKGTFPVERRRWAGLLESSPGSASELQERILASADAEIRRSMDGLGAAAEELARIETKGVWAVTWFAPDYPKRWRGRLGAKGPPVLFGMGELSLLHRPCAAILGSRNANPAALAFAELCAIESTRKGWAVASGGARGVDLAGAVAASRSGGSSVAICADALIQTHKKLVQAGCSADRLAVVTANHPDSGFSIGQAMGRNKLVYALAEVAIVAACESGSGGTWAGAVEALRAGEPPVAVWSGPGSPDGNRKLAAAGAIGVESPIEAFGIRVRQAQGGLFDREL